MAERASPSVLRVFGQRKMAAILLLGFSSGLPLYLTGRTLQAWMTVEGVDLATVGAASLLALPYSLKFLWAPLLDRYVPPFLGRRRGWIAITQLLLAAAIAAMAMHDPRDALLLLFVNALCISLFSATQDVGIDAYRVDALDEREMGAGASLNVLGYRAALLLTGGAAFVLADRLPWPAVYALIGGVMGLCVAFTLFAPEPVLRDGPPSTLASAVVEPFREFVGRAGAGTAALLLVFIVLYSMADRLAANMSTAFLLERAYTQTEIGLVLNGAGLVATLVGVLIGGAAIARLGLNRALWTFALLQLASNLAYWWLSVTPRDAGRLTVALVVENLCGGFVTAGFVALLMSLSAKKFSATQYALLSSVMALARDGIAALAGFLAAAAGWPAFFLWTIAAGIPALLLLPVVVPWNGEAPRGAAPHDGDVEAAA